MDRAGFPRRGGQARVRRISEQRMSFKPLRERGIPIEKQFRDWSELNVKPYDMMQVHPFSLCRGIVMNGIEVEAVVFSANMARHTVDPKIKQQLALVRRAEAQQQKAV